jgi:FkbH-like protein
MDWIQSLSINVKISALNESNVARATQLLNKTNQMNMATRRMSEVELDLWNSDPKHAIFVMSVSDKFGDSGLTGIIGLQVDEKTHLLHLIDFVMSCRVMGRRIENTMLSIVAHFAKERGLSAIEAQLKPTTKNKPCYDFFKTSGFEPSVNQDSFVWKVKEAYPISKGIDIEGMSCVN